MRALLLMLLTLAFGTAAADDERRILVTFADPGIINAARAGPARPAYTRRSSHYLVSVSVRRAADRLAKDFNLDVVDEWPIIPLKVHCLVYEVDEETSIDNLLAELRERPEVESAQRLNTFEVQGARTDPYANLQHTLGTLGLVEAHGFTQGDGASVAIIDTGADFEHPELARAIKEHLDFAGRGEFASEAHGTAIAGIIGAASGNGFGIVGVAPEARLYVLRACWYPERSASAVCDSFTLAKALSHAIESGTRIVNLSLGGPTDSLLARLVGKALEQGTIVVAAAPQTSGFPADVPGVIVVGAGGEGREASLMAPGVDILVPVPGGGFDYASGSSLSAAHVTGVIALMMSARPGIGHDDLVGLLAGSRAKDGGSINACRALSTMLRRTGCSEGSAAHNVRESD